MALQVTILKHKSNRYELLACVILTEYQNSNLSLSIFPDHFKSRLGEIPRMSTGTADMFYKGILSEDQKLVEVWHQNSIGDPDRKIATITDNGVNHNPFNF